MLTYRHHEIEGVESLREDFVDYEKHRGIVACERRIHQLEGVVVIEYVQVLEHVGILHVSAAESYGLVEYGKGIAHRAIGLTRYYVQGIVPYLHILLLRYAA